MEIENPKFLFENLLKLYFRDFNDDKTNTDYTHYVNVNEQQMSMCESKPFTESKPVNFDYDGDEEDVERLQHCHDFIDTSLNEEALEKKEIARRKLVSASIICTAFMTAEIIGGIMSHSIGKILFPTVFSKKIRSAILSDACHMFTDLSSFILSLIAIHLSKQKPTTKYNFGYSRIEVITAVFNVLFIWVITAALVMEAIDRVRNPDEYAIDGKVMLIVSSLAVFFNLT